MTTTTLESRFVFYQSFHDMIALIPDSETQLAAYGMICAYALEGTEPETDNWILNLLFYAVKPLIDSNRKRQENGKKGGRKQATEVQTEAAPAEQVTEEQKIDLPSFLVEEIEIQEINVDGGNIPTILVQEEFIHDNMVQKEDIPKILVQEEYQQEDKVQEEQIGVRAEPCQNEEILLYGANKYPVTQTELKKIQNYARDLFQKHNFGRILNEFDIDKIMKYTVARREINGVAVGVLDRDKTDLLEYAVEQAEAAEKLNWRYIEGIYRNFLLRDIKTADEAYQYDLSRSIPALQL